MSGSSRWILLTAVAVFALVSVLYSPVLGHELRSDDFQWVQQAHRAQVEPAQLFADLDSFYRPLNTWSLLVDRVIWGSNPAGYHLTNLFLHMLAALGLAVAARRVGLSSIASSVVAVIWAASPFTVPAMTSSLTSLTTGTLSPVTGAWLTVEMPLMTSPSTGIR